MIAPATGLCNIHFAVAMNLVAIAGAVVAARLVDPNAAADAYLLSRQVAQASTAGDGTALLQLVRADQFTHGNPIYEFTVTAGDGTLLSKFRAKAPNANDADADDLLP